MEVFKYYAEYYDLLYSTKNYLHEVEYVISLIKKYSPETKTILDLGCGTGTHGLFFAERKYDMLGVDSSSNMISIAQEKQQQRNTQNISFIQGNILSLRLEKQFDTVISLFHVMNYLATNDDMKSGFENAVKHLRKGGLFIFDSWYGPAVLTDLPKNGVKRLENEKIKVTRIVEPVLHPNRNVVDVNYEIIVEEKQTGKVSMIKETHTVRYFFKPELELLFDKLGLEILSCEEWLTSKEIGINTFGVCFVTRKK